MLTDNEDLDTKIIILYDLKTLLLRCRKSNILNISLNNNPLQFIIFIIKCIYNYILDIDIIGKKYFSAYFIIYGIKKNVFISHKTKIFLAE